MVKLAYNMKELVEATGLGRTTLFALAKAGTLTRIKCGNRTLITASSVEAYLKQLVDAAASS